MEEDKDIRWRQRFSNFCKALSQLEKFVNKGDTLNELEETGMIKAFEFTYEMAWNTMKDFYETERERGLQGSRDTIRLAFKRELISDGKGWMKMLDDRNQTSHAYNEEVAAEIAAHIFETYFDLFVELKKRFEKIIAEAN